MDDKLMNCSTELQWCADDFRPTNNCDDDDEHYSSAISFSNRSLKQIAASGNRAKTAKPTVNTNGYINNQNFDINLAEVDIDTFRSEDLMQRMIRSQNQLDASTDTLRIVESLRSLNDIASTNGSPLKHQTTTTTQTATQNTTNDTALDAISVDSLDLSLDCEIDSRLIEKCSQQDKHRYRIALFDTSTHSALDTSADYGLFNGQATNSGVGPMLIGSSRNPFEEQHQATQNGQQALPTTPGSLVKMFMQNRASNENSYYSSSSTEAFNGQGRISQQQSIDPQSCATPSVATVDSGDLPLHVLDISKKLKSMNLRAINAITSSASISSNTSFTSTTSSSTFDNNVAQKMRRQYSCGSSTNPFVMEDSRTSTRSTSTQFPEMYQEKGIQASPDDSPTKDDMPQNQTPVLVYYPNYSLPDLSFLDDILKDKKPVYLSPVKHEPPKFLPANVNKSSSVNSSCSHLNGVQKRINCKSIGISGISSQPATVRKCRPKSFTDYEMLLTQEFNPIQDWDSLNLLLPEDFKEFMEKNNLLPNPSERRPSGPVNYPIKHQQQANPQVQMRKNVNRANRASQRYSLQEMMPWNGVIYNEELEHELNIEGNYEQIPGSSMVRSQTMPNCVPPPLPPSAATAMCYPSAPPCGHHPQMMYHYMHPSQHIYPFPVSSHQQQQQHHGQHALPSMPSSMQWDMMSSTSFKKLMNFLSKLDDSTVEHSSEATLRSQPIQNDEQQNQRQPSATGGIQVTKSVTPSKKLSVQSSRANIAARTKSVNNAHQHNEQNTGQAPRIPPRNSNLRSSVIRPPELPKRTNNSATITATTATTTTMTTNPPNSTRIVLKRPSTLKSGIPLPSQRPIGISNIPKPVTRTTINNTQQQNQTFGRQNNRQNRTCRPPF